MKVLQLVIAAILGSVITLGAYKMLDLDQKIIIQNDVKAEQIKDIHVQEKAQPIQVNNIPNALGQSNKGRTNVPFDFTEAAAKTMPAVVHIKSITGKMAVQTPAQGGNTPPNDRSLDIFRDLFGDDFFGDEDSPFNFGNPYGRNAPSVSSGSGVIISDDGYIVTNNHVIDEADEIEVTLFDKRTFTAELIGTDPSTDIALIKVKGDQLPKLELANSDDARVGEWVLAVGNPFNLASTVTAGIVSAKGRNLNILQDQSAIESFIQTDAAVNRGNSGGALVNVDGDLLGINTAIATPTGTYAGYAFAVPANIVQKVVDDLKEYGVVQRGYIGVMIRDLDGNLAKDQGIALSQGVLIDSVLVDGAAFEAGLENGDVITEAAGAKISKSPELLGVIARHRPGDQIDLTVNRGGKELFVELTLRNRRGNMEVIKKDKKSELINKVGLELEELSDKELRSLSIRKGVKVKAISEGVISKQTAMEEGFVITKVGEQAIGTIEEFVEAIEATKGGVMLEGFYPGVPNTYYYAFGLE